jgi:hypothetical protein
VPIPLGLNRPEDIGGPRGFFPDAATHRRLHEIEDFRLRALFNALNFVWAIAFSCVPTSVTRFTGLADACFRIALRDSMSPRQHQLANRCGSVGPWLGYRKEFASFAAVALMMLSRSMVDLASRSKRVTTTMSPV